MLGKIGRDIYAAYPIIFECYFTRHSEHKIDVRYYLSCGDKSGARDFHERLGLNPLGLVEIPEWLESGKYRYMHVYRLGDKDNTEKLKQVSIQVRNLIISVQKQMKRTAKEQKNERH